jgi:cephalosporin hydroxylase
VREPFRQRRPPQATHSSSYAAAAMRVVGRFVDRIAHERRKRTIRRFHRLYYESSWQTWKNTRWLDVNAYKTPLDLWVYQELIVALRPQLIVETGTAAGGSALFLATVCDAVGRGEILSIDSEPRPGRPAHDRVTYLTGSSTAPETLEIVAERAQGKAPVMVILDSDHSREHVLAELRDYAEFVTPGSYLVVEDTNLSGHPVVRNFGPGPMEAVRDFLRERGDFNPDTGQEKFFLSFNPGGYLRRVSPASVQALPVARSTVAPRRRALARVAAAVALLLLVFVGLPELLGDRPYDPRPSVWPDQVSHHM